VRITLAPLLRAAIGSRIKENVSPLLYLIAIPLAFVQVGIADALYVIVALIWLVPDQRIERALADERSAIG